MTELSRSPRFAEDVNRAIDGYLDQAGAEVALRFVDAVEASAEVARKHPALGSAHYADVAQLQGLRSRAVEGFPYVLFYLRSGEDVLLLRLLHGRRDIASGLQDEPGEL